MDISSKMDIDISLPVKYPDAKKKNEYSPSPSQIKSNCDSETRVYGQLIVLGYVYTSIHY